MARSTSSIRAAPRSAKVAGEHVFIRPGTDVFFYLAFLHELLASGGVDRERVERFMTGFDTIARLAEPWTPERSERVTRMPAAKLREMVAAYRGARGAALYSSTGVNMGGNGALAFWIQEVINAVSGNLDRRGGTLVGRGLIDFARFGVKNGILMRDETSRVGGFRSVNDAFPGGVLADEILTPGPQQVRALFVTGGNPLVTMANAGPHAPRVRATRPARHARHLPQRDRLAGALHPALHDAAGAPRPALHLPAHARAAVAALSAGDRAHRRSPTASSATRLDLRRSRPRLRGRPVRLARRPARLRARHVDVQPRAPRRAAGDPAEAAVVAAAARDAARQLQGLLAAPHGTARPPHAEDDYLGQRVVTEDGRVHLAPTPLLEQARKLDADFDRELANADRLKLITRRAVNTHNSWTHNDAEFISGGRHTNYLYVHPNDAARAGLRDGDLADVSSPTATVRVPIRLLDDLMPGTVALPHGWGHQHATGLSVASRTAGVNVNLLAADGPEQLERVSGMAHLTGIVVDVRPAAGAQAADDWSGIAAG